MVTKQSDAKCRFCKRTMKSHPSLNRGYGIKCGKKHNFLLKQEDLERRGQLRLFERGNKNELQRVDS